MDAEAKAIKCNVEYKVPSTNSAKVVFKNRYAVYVNNFSRSTVIDLQTNNDLPCSIPEEKDDIHAVLCGLRREDGRRC